MLDAHTYDRNIKLVQVPPGLGLGFDDVDLLEGEGPLVPHIRQHRSRLRAEPAVLAGEEGYPTGLEEPARDAHGWRLMPMVSFWLSVVSCEEGKVEAEPPVN